MFNIVLIYKVKTHFENSNRANLQWHRHWNFIHKCLVEFLNHWTPDKIPTDKFQLVFNNVNAYVSMKSRKSLGRLTQVCAHAKYWSSLGNVVAARIGVFYIRLCPAIDWRCCKMTQMSDFWNLKIFNCKSSFWSKKFLFEHFKIAKQLFSHILQIGPNKSHVSTTDET